MEFWRAEMLLEIHKEKTEEENRRRKAQEEKEQQSVPNMGSLISQQKDMFKGMGGMPKMPG